MAFFSPTFLEFFEELAFNNNKEWFDENRDIYHNEIRDPFKDFAQAVALKIGEFDPVIDPSPYIYRINNDLRFQPEKVPYKLHKSASFSPVSDARATGGYYIELSATGVFMGGGLYEVPTKMKYQVREHIASNLDEFQQLYQADDFVEYFGEIEGKKNKRLPSHLKEAYIREPLLFNTQWVYSSTLPAELILSDKILEELMIRYRAICDLNQFFRLADLG